METLARFAPEDISVLERQLRRAARDPLGRCKLRDHAPASAEEALALYDHRLRSGPTVIKTNNYAYRVACNLLRHLGHPIGDGVVLDASRLRFEIHALLLGLLRMAPPPSCDHAATTKRKYDGRDGPPTHVQHKRAAHSHAPPGGGGAAVPSSSSSAATLELFHGSLWGSGDFLHALDIRENRAEFMTYLSRVSSQRPATDGGHLGCRLVGDDRPGA